MRWKRVDLGGNRSKVDPNRKGVALAPYIRCTEGIQWAKRPHSHVVPYPTPPPPPTVHETTAGGELPCNTYAGKHEMGVIDRYAAVISTLDGSLEAREGDEFLVWLTSQGFPGPASSSSGAPNEGGEEEARPEVDAAAPAKDSVADDDAATANGRGGESEAGGALGERDRVKSFFSAAAARLNTLVSDKEEVVFRDRGGDGVDKGKKAAEVESEGGVAGVSPKMTDEEVYQVACAYSWYFLGVSGCRVGILLVFFLSHKIYGCKGRAQTGGCRMDPEAHFRLFQFPTRGP